VAWKRSIPLAIIRSIKENDCWLSRSEIVGLRGKCPLATCSEIKERERERARARAEDCIMRDAEYGEAERREEEEEEEGRTRAHGGGAEADV